MVNLIQRAIRISFFETVSTLFLLSLYLLFIYRHLSAIKNDTLTPTALIILAMESVVIFLLLIRKQPKSRTNDFKAWFFAFSGTFLPLLFIPNGTIIHLFLGETLFLIGGVMATMSYISLNNSFGISPALRIVKTDLMYSVVRHPIYLSYIILFSGYLLIVFSPFNMLLFLLFSFCLLLRIHFEEQVLIQNETYRDYSQRVKYRLLPFLY